MKGTNRTSKKRRNKGYKKVHTVILAAVMAVLAIGFFLKITAIDVRADEPDRYKYYTSVYVDRDDTLWEISQKYVSEEYSDVRDYMDEVKAINGLMDDELPYGITICVPYYSEEFK
ncbi:MAG: hypothetical protein KH828_07000 [Clostridiales bacterium]|nr:hypothetical protein [Clostridiales bacterium]